MDCGPSCLKIVAKHYGQYYSLQYLRDLCGLTKEGVSMAGIGYAAEKIGFRSMASKCTVNDILYKIPLPAIIHWNNSHFVVVYRISKGKKIHVSDPAKGLVSYTKDIFKEKWLINIKEEKGYCLLLEPTGGLKDREKQQENKQKKTLENFLAYLKPYHRKFVNLFVLMLLITIMQASLPFISKAVIDVGIQTQDIDFINIVLIANIALIVSITLSNAARDWILQHLTARINIALISDYLIKLMKLPVAFFETKMTGDILQRANDHERIRSFIMNNSLNLIFSSLTFIVFGIILLIYNNTVFYIFLAGSLFYILWVLAFFNIRKKLDWNYFELTAKNQSYWVETINSIQDIKINNYERSKRWKWERIQAKLYKVNLKMLNINNMQNMGAQFIDSLKNVLITFFCAKAVIAGEITFGVMISTQFIIGMLNTPVTQFIQFIIGFQIAQISFLRLNEIHQLANEDEGVGENSIDFPKNKSLLLHNVVFQYTPVSSPTLRGLSLVIPEGKITAIVGDSGSGKSTLLKLLLRIYNT